MMNLIRQRSAGYKDLTVQDAHPLTSTLTVIDVRGLAEYHGDLGHIPGSASVPLERLIAAAKDWDKDTPLLVVCRSGRRSASACDALSRAGFSQVHNLAGGMLAWNQSGIGACSHHHPTLECDSTPTSEGA